MSSSTLPAWRSVLAVVAHPDDESFGLGGVLTAFVAWNAEVAVLILTRGEASTLGGGVLDEIRPEEARRAAEAMGIGWLRILDHPDGGLAEVDRERLVAAIRAAVEATDPEGIVVFGPGGITGHPDHVAASEVALEVAIDAGLPVLGIVVSSTVADRLRDEFGVRFVGVDRADLEIPVDRIAHGLACDQHPSQDNPVVRRRLAISGDHDWLVWMHRPG